MKLEIIKEPDDRLRVLSEEVSFDEKYFNDLLGQMRDTMLAYGGIGLAAPQIGIAKRVFIANVRIPRLEELIYIANPEIIRRTKRTIAIDERCLSCPEITVRVPRSFGVKVVGYDPRSGRKRALELTGVSSVIVQHEIDHLDGRLIVDYM